MKPYHCLMLLALPLLAACGKPQPPETERRPEPQVAAMREAIAEPLKQAKEAAAATEDAAKAEKAALDATAGTSTTP
ncbi:hypothetical protein ABB26_03490 [Stenotrophomonas humi]|uniref:Lipoprotein n=1 Tax=Stenotrophomonas humi TaxID=405444 RepID=A0A0R0CJ28_9GAMM|nr:hypothetical protein [Stenotrophomonas humi]KRG65617.1 hypothetical protein ABB26_03490 [Stenotrophomonas humi]